MMCRSHSQNRSLPLNDLHDAPGPNRTPSLTQSQRPSLRLVRLPVITELARPDDVSLSANPSQTSKGRIMQRLSTYIAEGRTLGATTTPANPAVVERLKNQYEAEEG